MYALFMSIQDFKPTDWGRVRNFTPAENWGDPEKVNASLVYIMDALRNWLGWPIFINNAFAASGHATKSQHYVGNADDFRIDCDLDFAEQVRLVEEFLEAFGLADQVGFGIYPNWHRPGFHLDVRGKRARWGAVPDGNGGQMYVSQAAALDWHRLHKGA